MHNKPDFAMIQLAQPAIMLASQEPDNPKGRYRTMDYEQLVAVAGEPYWDDEQTKLKYSLPVPAEGVQHYWWHAWRLSRGIPRDQLSQLGPYRLAASPESHIACFRQACDFLVPDGTPVLAMQDGVVDEFRDHNTEHGDGAEYAAKLNFITIRSDNGELHQYGHLMTGSVGAARLFKSARVKAGQQIGVVGKTGWTDRDHLHVTVFREDLDGPFVDKGIRIKSLKIRWAI